LQRVDASFRHRKEMQKWYSLTVSLFHWRNPKNARMLRVSQMPTENAGKVLQVNGIDLYYEKQGVGEPLLLLHGGSGSHEDWVHAGRDDFMREYTLIMPDARGHGRSTNPVKTITHRQCALDTLALLDHLSIAKCKAIGLSMGGNILLHMATLQPDRIEAMVVVSSTMYFPEQARAIMRQVPIDNQPPKEWETMRKRHKHGDGQIMAIWEWLRDMADSHDDMNFTPPSLARITARTLVVYGDRDFLYPIEMAIDMYRAIPQSTLWVVPKGGHGPVFLDAAPFFVKTAMAFLRG
jgi:pimeloyl-ACP methyl ester carboxylesterase